MIYRHLLILPSLQQRYYYDEFTFFKTWRKKIDRPPFLLVDFISRFDFRTSITWLCCYSNLRKLKFLFFVPLQKKKLFFPTHRYKLFTMFIKIEKRIVVNKSEKKTSTDTWVRIHPLFGSSFVPFNMTDEENCGGKHSSTSTPPANLNNIQ